MAISKDSIELLKTKLLKSLREEEIEKDARATGFVERRSPVSGTAFLLAMMAGPQAAGEATLTELSAFLESAANVRVTPQALDGRFHDRAADFLETCLQKILASAGSMPHKVTALSRFDHAYLMDSTNFDLSPSLSGVFKGSGGGASKSAMRIQFALDFCTGTMHQEIGDVRLSDPPALASMVQNGKVPLDGRSLILADLGYYKTETIADICARPGLFFISKVPYNRHFNKPDGNRLDLDRILLDRPQAFEEIVVVGGARCRLVASRLDGATAGERIRKADATSAKKQRSGFVADKYRRFLHYSMFLTNLDDEYRMEKLYVLYRIRWQIELVFKGWKSVLGIDRHRSAKAARVRCEVYGRLIAATVAAVIEGLSAMTCEARILSRFKTLKVLAARSYEFARAILRGPKTLETTIDELVEFIAKRCRKSRSKHKPSIEERLKNAFIAENNRVMEQASLA